MASRGDVFSLTRRIGFTGAGDERVVVLQATRLNQILPTIVIAPVDRAEAIYSRNPLAIPVSAAETGLPYDGVLVLSALSAVPRDRLTAAPAGRLTAPTLASVNTILPVLLGLP